VLEFAGNLRYHRVCQRDTARAAPFRGPAVWSKHRDE